MKGNRQGSLSRWIKQLFAFPLLRGLPAAPKSLAAGHIANFQTSPGLSPEREQAFSRQYFASHFILFQGLGGIIGLSHDDGTPSGDKEVSSVLTWNENYLMGIEEFDTEHRKLFHVAEQILDRLRSREEEDTARMFVVREGLNYLKGYFASHAAREEAYMRRIHYEGYALHKTLHDDFQRIQLAKYQKIVDSGTCTREDAWDFIGSGIGWLLEHITTADLAIVGKGVLSMSAVRDVNAAVLENAVNLLFAATLNLEANARIIRTNYGGEPFGQGVYQKFIYQMNGQEGVVISGIERPFLLDVAKRLYGAQAEYEMDLVLSTLEMFGAQFWVTLGRQLAGFQDRVDVKGTCFLTGGSLAEELQKLNPALSVLFSSDKGKFFVSASSPYMESLFGRLA